MILGSSVHAAPPPTKRIDQVDVLHGVKIADPYRWLEDVDSPETRAWVEAQSKYARDYLDKLPGREKVAARLEQLFDYTRAAVYNYGSNTYAGILKRGGKLFFLRQDGLQNQPVLYVEEAGGQPRELLNPNGLSSQGTAAISTWSPSPDGKWLAYGVAKAGSDWQEWRVRDVATGKDLDDFIEWIKFADPVWSPDGAGFYYARFPKPEGENLLTAANTDNKLYYHRLHTNQSEDRLIYERPDHKTWSFDARPLDDGQRLVVLVSDGTRVEKLVYLLDLSKPGAPMREIVSKFEGDFDPIAQRGNEIVFYTTWQAPKGRVAAYNLDTGAWRNVIAEAAETASEAVFSGGRLICEYMKDARTVVRIFMPDGKLVREVALPGLGTAHWTLGLPGEKEQFYAFAGFMSPWTIYRYDLETGESSPLFRGTLNFDPAAFETKQVFYTSKDGTRVPMFLSHKKGVKPDASTPALLYGYGGFNISLTPSFSVLYLSWMEMGGVVAVANLRGGGEYGEAWHQAGMKHNKQNVFDDFISAAEWLIANKYTSTPKLAIMGGSNGGLLVGACLNQRPDLFGAAIPMVGVMDMLRFHKFTIGAAWESDYGSPDDPEDFAVLRKYSPLDNIKRGTKYPPTLVMTADHDDRVVPSHSFKYGATMQYAQEGSAPILIRIEASAGHGAGKPTTKIIEEQTDILSFLRQSLKMQ